MEEGIYSEQMQKCLNQIWGPIIGIGPTGITEVKVLGIYVMNGYIGQQLFKLKQ